MFIDILFIIILYPRYIFLVYNVCHFIAAKTIQLEYKSWLQTNLIHVQFM